ncbi:hypothetical protein A0H81_14970, partial [Grifola frondosa]
MRPSTTKQLLGADQQSESISPASSLQATTPRFELGPRARRLEVLMSPEALGKDCVLPASARNLWALFRLSQDMTEASQLAKRTRQSSGHGPIRGHHPKFWYPDGNIVLRVGDTLFRLYRTRLMQYSACFANLLRVSNNDATGMEAEGNSDDDVHNVAGVDVDDFEYLLVALEVPLSFSLKSPSKRMSPPGEYSQVIGSVMRAAQGLSCHTAIIFATDALCRLWPTDFARLTPTRLSSKDAMQALMITKRYNIPGIVKRACYELVHRVFLEGTPLDLLRLPGARNELQHEWINTALLPPVSDPYPCKSTEGQCAQAWANGDQTWRVTVVQSEIFIRGRTDPVCGLDALSNVDWTAQGFCSLCMATRKLVWAKKKEELWRQLEPWLQLETVDQSGEVRMSG